MSRLLVGGYTGDKGQGSGISVVEDGQVVATVPTKSPSWITMHPYLPVLYAVTETDDGGVRAWSVSEGVPGPSLGSGETGGAEPAHLVVDPSGQFLITANYTGGSIAVHRLGPDGSIGERTDLVQHRAHGTQPRQDSAHPHMVRADNGTLLVTDLGADAIYRYRLDPDGRLRLQDKVSTPAGSGPRHLLRAGDRYYVTAELSGQLLDYDADWQLLGATPASAAEGENYPSELVTDGSHRYLYIANRGPDTVSVFSLEYGRPRYVTEVAVGGWPRHIVLDGDLLYVANERSHEVLTMRIDAQTGVPVLMESVEVPSPTSVLP